MDRLYSYSDFEYLYYHYRVKECIEVGLYLLSKLKDARAKKLYKELKKITFSWDLSEKDLKHLTKLLDDVKIWLMIHKNRGEIVSA